MFVQTAQAAAFSMLPGFQYNFNSFSKKFGRAGPLESTHTIPKKYHHSHKT
jgi:hypothetical protein